MAIPEVCALWIEQRIDEELEANPNGSRLQMATIIADEIKKHFEVDVKPNSIRMKIVREEKKANCTNVQSISTNQNQEESYENRRYPDGTFKKGVSGNPAGRNPKHMKEKSTKTMSQKAVWLNVVNKMARLSNYMLKNCETPADIPEKTKRSFIRYFDTLEVFKNGL